MDLQQKTKRFGIYMILCACILRLFTSEIPEKLVQRLTQTDSVPFLTYLETGRNVRFSASSVLPFDHFRESPAPWLLPEEGVSFAAEDLALAELDDDSGLAPDLKDLLEKPLDWNLRDGEPTVLLLHTHTTESYTKKEETYEETTRYRTLDEAYNMLSIGDAVVQLLEAEGIGVIHDRQLHDYPSYNGAYAHARQSEEAILEQYPSIRLILDLHRDAVEAEGGQLRTQAVVEGVPSAQLMLVVGTNASWHSHEKWEDNLALALKLHIQLERQAPGIMRPVNLRRQRFNQDLSPGALLVEVGAAGNSHAEAEVAARELAKAVIALAQGTAAD